MNLALFEIIKTNTNESSKRFLLKIHLAIEWFFAPTEPLRLEHFNEIHLSQESIHIDSERFCSKF